MVKEGGKPPPEDEIKKALGDAIEGIVDEMSEMSRSPRLTLSDDEVQRALVMDEEAFAAFLAEKGIDFQKPTRIVTPTGTSEAWMYSPADVRRWLFRVYSS